MSMSALARAIGVSPSMISQIERGQTLPSVETLFALAHALGASVDTFFENGPATSLAADGLSTTRPRSEATSADGRLVVPKEARATIAIHGGIRWERLTPRAMEDFEFLELIYEPGAESSEHLYPHPGYEMVLVLSGRFEIQVGFEHYTLDPGDSIAFDSSLPHRYVNPLSQESRAVTTILHTPPVGASGDGVSHRALRRGHP
jgi:transcriptional regulator with XRE-family HTH domain